MNDPTAQMGFQVGKSAVMAGQEYVESNVSILSFTNGCCIWPIANGEILVTVQPLCERLGSQTLLQCIEFLRPQ